MDPTQGSQQVGKRPKRSVCCFLEDPGSKTHTWYNVWNQNPQMGSICMYPSGRCAKVGLFGAPKLATSLLEGSRKGHLGPYSELLLRNIISNYHNRDIHKIIWYLKLPQWGCIVTWFLDYSTLIEVTIFKYHMFYYISVFLVIFPIENINSNPVLRAVNGEHKHYVARFGGAGCSWAGCTKRIQPSRV